MFTHSLDHNSSEPKGKLGPISLNVDAAQAMKSHLGLSAIN